MAGHRIERINADAQRVLAEIVRNLKDPRIPLMTSVSAVRITQDLKYGKVFVSVLGSEEEKAAAFAALASASGHIRRQMAAGLDLRNTPELTFERDDSIEHLSRIDGILKGIGASAAEANGEEE